MPIEQKGQTRQSAYPWLTENRFRIVMQCQDFRYGSEHQIAWVDLDLDSIEALAPDAPWNPESVRVIEYDAVSKEPITHSGSSSGLDALLVPCKTDRWSRRKGNAGVRKNPQLAWLRRPGDASNAVYICYFDVAGHGEQESIVEPSCLGSGDALSYGCSGVEDAVRGTPFVFDFDQDGKKDFLGALGLVPERGTYFYKNIGSSNEPAFAKPVFISWGRHVNGCRQLTDVDGDGKLDAVGGRGGYYSDVHKNGFSSWVDLSMPLESDLGEMIKKGRVSNWYITDWDGDSVNDVVFGSGYWGDYGWSNAFDESGAWTNGPLHGWFYFSRNTGSNSHFVLSDPVRLYTADGDAAEVFGYPNPVVADFNGDGLPDLVTGDFVDGIYIFKNTGTRNDPVLEAPQRIATTDGDFIADFQANYIFADDFNDDGHIDIFTRGEDDGVGYLENTGTLTADNRPVFHPIKYLTCENDFLASGQLPAIDLYDWDGDGDLDLIYGHSPGFIGWYECISAYPSLQFAGKQLFKDQSGSPIRIIAGENGSIQGPAEALWGYTVPSVADWNADGFPDIILNSVWGKIVWFENPGSFNPDRLLPERPVFVEWKGDAPKPAWRWWDPAGKEWSTQWRSTVQILDWDKDGLLDAVALDPEGYLVLHRRCKQRDELLLGPGERIFKNSAGDPWQINPRKPGGCGRRKFEFADWDRDGDYDLIVDNKEVGGNVSLYINTSSDESPQLILDDSLADIIVSGHTCSPALFDLEGDGVLDLLLAAEDGHFYCFHRSYLDHKEKLQAFFVDNGQRILPTEKTVLFDDEIVVGQVLNATLNDQNVYSGAAALYTQNDSNTFFCVSLDLKGNIDILDSHVLELYINFQCDSGHPNTELKWVQLCTYNGPYDAAGRVKYYPYKKAGNEAASYFIDDIPVRDGAGTVGFDDDKRTWQKMTLDLNSGPGMPVVGSLKPSSVVRRIDFVFKGSTQVCIDLVTVSKKQGCSAGMKND